jgi:hypothetical protein
MKYTMLVLAVVLTSLVASADNKLPSKVYYVSFDSDGILWGCAAFESKNQHIMKWMIESNEAMFPGWFRISQSCSSLKLAHVGTCAATISSTVKSTAYFYQDDGIGMANCFKVGGVWNWNPAYLASLARSQH